MHYYSLLYSSGHKKCTKRSFFRNARRNFIFWTFIRIYVYKIEPPQSGEHFDYKIIAFYQKFLKYTLVLQSRSILARPKKTHQSVETIKNKTFMKKDKHMRAKTTKQTINIWWENLKRQSQPDS